MMKMKYPAIFGFYGKSGSGKTALIEQLIKHLKKEKYKVATIKNSNKNIQIDKRGKDTWRHAKAGAELNVLNCQNETVFFIKTNLPSTVIIDLISELNVFDVILIEGAKDPDLPKIRIGDIKFRENTIIDYKDNMGEIIKIIKDEIDKLKKISHKISVFVNGKKVPISEFPASIIKNGIMGMLFSLKGVATIKNVKIQFSI